MAILHTDKSAWKKLKQHADQIQLPENHLKYLIKQTGRIKKFSLSDVGLFYDFSRQRIDDKTLETLLELAKTKSIQKQYNSMAKGKKVNITEKRAALHTASRNFSDNPVFVDGKDIMPEIKTVRKNIKKFALQIHKKEITGSTGKPFKHIVVVGIGGSYLGTEFVSTALQVYANKNIHIHYLSNVDIHNFGKIASDIDPETTLWIIISKSFTTAETLANAKLAYEFVKEKGLDPAKHFISVTSKNSPGDTSSNTSMPNLCSFHMFDYIGGRYSVTSAVGGVPLSLYLGYDNFEQFLKGAEEMDNHALNAPLQNNIPIIAALIGIWNSYFLKLQSHAIIPYIDPLSKLAPHIQQLSMESNGKAVSTEDTFLDDPAGYLVFGEPGTNAQHSFFQLAHQGRPFPIDFIGVINPWYDQFNCKSKGVSNHQELWANLISQPNALAIGKDNKNKAKYFSGNRPSSTIIINDLSPKNIGHILAFYEAKTVFEAFIMDINPFDQFGVELGKITASGIRKEIAAKNDNSDHQFTSVDPTSKLYLDMLFSGNIH